MLRVQKKKKKKKQQPQHQKLRWSEEEIKNGG